MTAPDTEFDPERVVVRDKRRIDPVSGEVREGYGADAPAAADAGDELSADLDRVAAELTADLQRVQAEYANYRKRVDRDRALVVEMATAGLLNELLPLLDDVERARQHGDLDGAFKSVGEGIEGLADKLGLQRFGAVGEPFDPAVHEALMTVEPTGDSDVAVCAQVLQPGYRLTSGRVLRPARVAVAEPAASPEPMAAVPETPEQ
ncbi:nucleotide exchange factor GrpE [Nocardioides sp.]|uniref:nucleotide exchange factor GrpE n=1 Tax=Nocardioides sp. TaxID=35761 RepID=UPI002634E2B1|nr:nucleotide exchange factor GrpE [Nocardioides sp.]MCW2735602.1 GrpE protein [Nocardioides sp.]